MGQSRSVRSCSVCSAGVMDALGVRMDSVPVGKTEWPLITSGVAPDQAKETTAAAAAVTAGFSFANLKPKRITGRYELTHEMIASVPDIETALRRDLADAVKSKMSDIIINGQAPTTQNPQHIEGVHQRTARHRPFGGAGYGGLTMASCTPRLLTASTLRPTSRSEA